KVIGVGGDSALGGDDFDNLILQKIIAENNLNNLDISELQEIKLAAKEIKEELTNKESFDVKVNLKNQIINFKFTRKEFEDLSRNLVEKTINITNDLLEELDLEVEKIKAVILVGGSTRMKIVKEKLIEVFGQVKILSNIDPDKIVALGAAIQAEALTSRNSDNLLLDVIPLSIGIEMMGGLVDKIIDRNATIPTSAIKEFTTYADFQTGMKLHIVQGERELAKNCRSLAHFEIKNIPALKAGVARIKMVLKVDADGLLTVSATETLTGETQTIEVKPTFGLDEAQVKHMLLESLKNSKSDISMRLLVEAKMEAGRSILALKAEIKEDDNLIDEEFIVKTQNQIFKLEEAIKGDDQKLISLEAENLEKFAEIFAEKKMSMAIRETLIGKKIDQI
ncbi:MAG: molecular chaperone HscA, partial [Rickettsiales bacterium]